MKSAGEIITGALSGICPVRAKRYDGPEKKYITYNYASDRGTDYGDDSPGCNSASMQVHFFAPFYGSGSAINYNPLKKQIRKALHEAGCSYPSVIEFEEKDTDLVHMVFEFEILEEI